MTRNCYLISFTIITNEYNSSRTCMYCFGKLPHLTYAKNNNIKTTRGTYAWTQDDLMPSALFAEAKCLHSPSISLVRLNFFSALHSLAFMRKQTAKADLHSGIKLALDDSFTLGKRQIKMLLHCTNQYISIFPYSNNTIFWIRFHLIPIVSID